MREITKLKHSESHKFKQKVNEDQYKLNLKLGETLDNAKSTTQTLELDEGEKLLLGCQKHIPQADKSKSGLCTIGDYKKHDLAENCDNEKQIFSAEWHAEQLCPQ